MLQLNGSVDLANNYSLSIILPSIRTHLLDSWYDSAAAACRDHTFQVIITSPFEISNHLRKASNVVYLHSYSNPSVVTQEAILASEGELIFLTTDDGYFMDDCLSMAISAWQKHCSTKDIVNMRYREGQNYGGGPMPDAYWYPWSHPPLQLPGVKRSWFIAPQFMMSRNYFFDLGGIDCVFEYSNYGIHDMTFRAQAQGARIFQSPKEVLCANHFPDDTVDHKPIYDAQTFYDLPIFQKIYSDPDAAIKRGNIDYNNWKQYNKIWERRFDPNNLPKTYEEMMAQKNGKHKV